VAAGWRCRAIRIARTWQALRWPLAGEPQARSPQGSFALQGSIHRYHYELDGLLELAHLGRLTCTAAAMAIATASRPPPPKRNGSMASSRERASVLGPALRWQLQLAGRELDPGVLHPDWPGRLSLRAASHGRYDERLDAALTIEELAVRCATNPCN